MNDPSTASSSTAQSVYLPDGLHPPTPPRSRLRRLRDSAAVQVVKFLAVFLAVLVYLAVFLAVLVYLAVQFGPTLRRTLPRLHFGGNTHLSETLVAECLAAPAAVIALWIAARYITKRPFVTYGFSAAGLPRDVGVGFALGAALIAGTFMLEAVPGLYRVTGWNPHSHPGAIILLSLLVCVSEEVVFRGFLLQTVEDRHGTTAAVLVSAALFGLLHVPNFHTPGIGLFAGLSLAIGAGLPLAGLYLLTRRLWMPMAFHWAWDTTTFLLASTDMLGHVALVRTKEPSDWLSLAVILVTGGGLGVWLLGTARRLGRWQATLTPRAERRPRTESE